MSATVPTIVIARARVVTVTAADAALVAGVVTAVVGTFLPWLRSGSATRNSYATDGSVRRLLGPQGAVGVLLDVWPFLSIAGAVGVALVLLRYILVGFVVALIATTCAGGAAFVALSTDSNFVVRPATVGPAVTTAGAILVWLAAIVRLLPLDRIARRSR